MSISNALNNALSGLQAAGRASEVVASNISNSLNEGYGVRRLAVSSRTIGGTGGVAVNGVERFVNELLVSDRRLASAEKSNVVTTANFLARFETLLGTPDQPGSLSSRLSDFESALITASSRPDAAERLESGVIIARDLVATLKSASDGIQEERTRADRSITNAVTQLNDALQNVASLNTRIAAAGARGQDASAMMDHRQAILDEIGQLVPVRIDQRNLGTVAIYTTGGAILLDETAVEIGYTPSNAVTAYQTIDNGALSGLTLNGTAIDTTSDRSPLRGGTLLAHFKVRDEIAVDAQSQLDAFARDLVERYADPAVDPTLGAGDPGLFTDGGVAFLPINEVGLSTRLSINALVDPGQGGEAWRLRDGLGAVSPGNAGDATILQSLTDVLSTTRSPASGNFGTGVFSSKDLTATMLSQVGAARLQADRNAAFASSQLSELEQLELAEGVDTDAELQRLLLIEQAYAANARIIETADDMLQSLLRI